MNTATIETDNEGYLLNPDLCDETIALQIAESENIPMTDAHWEIVHFVRKYIHKLFPYGFGQQACKIAGMRKPLKLLLDL